MIGKLAKVRRCESNDRRRWQRSPRLRKCRVHQLQRGHHVHVPVKEQVDFGGAAAGDRAHLLQPRYAVDGFFDRPRDGDHHLIGRHDAVVNANDDAGKICGRKDRDRDGERQVHSGHRQDEGEED